MTSLSCDVPASLLAAAEQRARDRGASVSSVASTVVCRHEQNAAFIAGGIGRMTGRAGVAIATSGPSVSSLVTGLATANSEGDPMIGLGGANSIHLGRDR